MDSHELIREVLQAKGPKHVAEEMQLSLSMIYKWAEPPGEGGSGALNPLDRMEALVRATGDPRLVQWLAERAGGFFIRNPRGEPARGQALIPATNQVVQEFADLLGVIAVASTDSRISDREARSIRARWEELKSVTEGFVRCCEEGNFSALKHGLDRPPQPGEGGASEPRGELTEGDPSRRAQGRTAVPSPRRTGSQ